MPDGPADPPLPEHPELREFARAMEGAGVSGDIVDARWQTVFISSELARLAGVAPQEVSRYYGKSTRVTPVAVAPRAWQQSYEFRPENAFGRSLRSEMRFIECSRRRGRYRGGFPL